MNWINRSIRKKLIVSFIGVILLPLISSIYISYRNYAHGLEQSYIANNAIILEQLNSRMDDYFIQLEDLGLTFYSDLIFSQEYQLEENGYVLHNLKLKKLMSIYLGSKDTHSVLFYTPSTKELYVINKALNTSFLNADVVEEQEWYKLTREAKEKLVFEPSHILQEYPVEYRLSTNERVFSLSREIKGYSPEVGVLTINYKLDQLRTISKEVIQNPSEEIVLLNAQGVPIYSSASEPAKLDDALLSRIQSNPKTTDAFEYKDANSHETRLIVYSKSDYNGNILCKFIPLQIIVAQADQTRNINLILGFIIILFLVITTMVISFRLTKPLLRLQRFMVKAGEGNFQMPIAVTQKDEIGQISHAYNQMIGQIDTLINEKYKMKLANRESQWRALQAQINPHFMYNTLQTIGSVALDEGVEEVVHMTHSLSNMLRYSISAGERATLQDEVENVKDYLFIQKCRFEERLSYQIELQDTLGHFQVPKLLLQPLVENAIIHGIEPLKRRGNIFIRCVLDNNCLSITINDNGLGIQAGKLMLIQEQIAAPDRVAINEEESIGIANVLQRLDLMYGDKYRVSVQSSPNEGTTIDISIAIGT